jgi:gamma-glutamyltranspeptidase/glutathione hydrolase
MASSRLFLLLPLLFAAGCSEVEDTLGFSDGNAPAAAAAVRVSALAVADEPLAAKTGASILAQGGSAADAATAMFFTLSVTYPAAAGVGGGGICLARSASGQVQEFDFLPRQPAGGGAMAVPGAVRGFYDLQRAYGVLPWQRDVSPGESYAGAGFPISAMLALRIAAAQSVLRQDPALAGEFLNSNGQPRGEGVVVANPALAATLSQIRLKGAEGFYGEPLAAEIAAGAGLSTAELAAYRTTIAAGRIVRFGSISVALPGPQSGAGSFAETLLANISQAAAQQRLAPDAAAAAGVRQTLAGFRIASVPRDLGSTGFAATDSSGQAVACAMTLNAPFGAGRTVAGFTPASSPAGPAGYATAFLTPVLAMDAGGQLALAATGTGGPNGSAAVEYALLKLASGQPVLRPAELRATGAEPFATVNLIGCQTVCVAIADPAGHGLGAAANNDDSASP